MMLSARLRYTTRNAPLDGGLLGGPLQIEDNSFTHVLGCRWAALLSQQNSSNKTYRVIPSVAIRYFGSDDVFDGLFLEVCGTKPCY